MKGLGFNNHESSYSFEGRAGYVVIDQIRTVDREQLVRRLGKRKLS